MTRNRERNVFCIDIHRAAKILIKSSHRKVLNTRRLCVFRYSENVNRAICVVGSIYRSA